MEAIDEVSFHFFFFSLSPLFVFLLFLSFFPSFHPFPQVPAIPRRVEKPFRMSISDVYSEISTGLTVTGAHSFIFCFVFLPSKGKFFPKKFYALYLVMKNDSDENKKNLLGTRAGGLVFFLFFFLSFLTSLSFISFLFFSFFKFCVVFY